MIVALAEHDGGKPANPFRGERVAAGEPHLDGPAAGHMPPRQAGGQGGGVVGDHEVAGAQEVDQRGPAGVDDLPAGIDHQEPG
jgi:hypothetical protein